MELARRAQPLELRAAPGVFLAVAEGRLTAASFSLTTDQCLGIAYLLTDPSVGRSTTEARTWGHGIARRNYSSPSDAVSA